MESRGLAADNPSKKLDRVLYVVADPGLKIRGWGPVIRSLR